METLLTVGGTAKAHEHFRKQSDNLSEIKKGLRGGRMSLLTQDSRENLRFYHNY